MKYTLLLSCIYFAFQSGFSQESSSLFQSYINDDLIIRSMGVSGVLSGYNSNSDFFYAVDGGLSFSKFSNLQNKQSEINGNFSLDHSKFKDNYYTDIPIVSRFLSSGFINSRCRYYSKNKFFYSLGYDFNYILEHDNRFKFENFNRNEQQTSYYFNLNIPLSTGFGRKYSMAPVHQSMWMYSELEKEGVLNHRADNADIEQLARTIEKNFYIRYYDYRYKRKDDLIRLDSVLQSRNMIVKSDIRYITTLYDMYDYATGYNRYKGSILEGGVSWQIRYDYYKNTVFENNSESKYDLNSRFLFPFLFVEYNKYNPINMHWQFEYGVHADFGFKNLIHKNNDLNSYYKQKNFECQAILRYYPNTRSYFTIAMFAQYGNKFTNDNPPSLSTYTYFGFTDFYNYDLINNYRYNYYAQAKEYWSDLILLEHYYYINPKLKVRTNFYLYYADDNTNISTPNKFRTSFRISLSYAVY